MEWGRLLENKSAFRPFWGCGEGKGGEGCAESRLGTADEEQVGWQSGGCTRLLTCRIVAPAESKGAGRMIQTNDVNNNSWPRGERTVPGASRAGAHT